MEIEFLILADAVEAIQNKIYMLGGGWDRYNSQVFPTPPARIGIAVGILVDWNETNQKHPLRITILDADAKPLVPDITGEFEAGRPAGVTPGTAQRTLLAINANLPLPRAGRYEVRVVAGTAERSVAFEARLVAAGPPSPR